MNRDDRIEYLSTLPRIDAERSIAIESDEAHKAFELAIADLDNRPEYELFDTLDGTYMLAKPGVRGSLTGRRVVIPAGTSAEVTDRIAAALAPHGAA